jgi:hypothetical protein
MEFFKSSARSHDGRVPYLKREGPRKGAIFVSHNGERRLLPDSWLSCAELTDDERLLTLHYSAGKIRVRGHELGKLFEEVSRGCLGEICECGSPAPDQGLWVTEFEWLFPIEQTEDLASYVPAHLRE